MYQRAELFSTLQQEDISSTLSACTLPDKQEYTESEADRFRECLDLIGQGKSYKQVAAHFRRIDKNLKPQNGQDEVDTTEAMLEISELLALAGQQCGTRISLKEAAVILDSCGLPDTDFYSSEDGERFLEVCNLIKKQNKTHEEVAEHFGRVSDLAGCPSTHSDIQAEIESVASNLDQSSNSIVSEVMRYKAKVDASLAPTFYLQHLSNEFGSPEFKAAWHQMELALKAEVVGKSRNRARQMPGEIRAIPPSHSPSNALPIASDNGSTSD